MRPSSVFAVNFAMENIEVKRGDENMDLTNVRDLFKNRDEYFGKQV